MVDQTTTWEDQRVEIARSMSSLTQSTYWNHSSSTCIVVDNRRPEHVLKLLTPFASNYHQTRSVFPAVTTLRPNPTTNHQPPPMNLIRITYVIDTKIHNETWINPNEILSIEQQKDTLIKFTNGQEMYTEERAEKLVNRIRTLTA